MIKGTRMRVGDVLELLAAGATETDILADFPYLKSEDIRASLSYAAGAIDHRVVSIAA